MKIDKRKFRFFLISHLIKCRRRHIDPYKPYNLVDVKINRKQANEIYNQIKLNKDSLATIIGWVYPRIGSGNVIGNRSIKILDHIYTTRLSKEEIKELKLKKFTTITHDNGDMEIVMR